MCPPRRHATRSCFHCRGPISVRRRILRGRQTAAKWKPGCCGQRSGRPSMSRSRRAPHRDRDMTSSHQANQSLIPESTATQQAPRASLKTPPPTATIHQLKTRSTRTRSHNQDHTTKITQPRSHTTKTTQPRPHNQDHTTKTTQPRPHNQDHTTKTTQPRPHNQRTQIYPQI